MAMVLQVVQCELIYRVGPVASKMTSAPLAAIARTSSSVSSGVYLYRVVGFGQEVTQKMALVK